MSLDDHLPGTKQLRRLGLHEGLPIEVLHGPDPVILLCHRSKIAVSRESLCGVTISVGRNTGGCGFFAALCDLFRNKSSHHLTDL